MANTSVTAVKGFRAAAMHVGIKASGKPDLAVLASAAPATAGAVFTQNKVVGAPIIVGRKHMKGGVLRACVVNSGCANVCTGERGVRDALEMCKLTAEGLVEEGGEFPIAEVLPFSTGVIGHFLPMEKVRAGIPAVIAKLSDSEEAGAAFAHGILTTDLVAKTAYETVMIGGKKVTIAGCCKGSGMIAPNMAPPQATMLAFVASDAAIDRRALQGLVKEVADRTFNCVTVDQHTSTSDTFVALANGMAGNRKIVSGADAIKFGRALLAVCDSLAQQIARDGEGATKLVTVIVSGAKSPADAKRAAEAIANSALVKTAIHGGDPNWGRFVSAAGYSGAAMNPDKSLCKVGSIPVFKNGHPTGADLKKVQSIMQAKDLTITVDLGTGGRSAHRVYTCDLSREYIAINADYHT
jgi:glutamate N-acetyltransferase / amino-acid N-acetyltransferase